MLTVGEVAERFGVARSTVYEHWEDWGGFKLGKSETAPIRFDSGALPAASPPPPAPKTHARSRSDGAGRSRKSSGQADRDTMPTRVRIPGGPGADDASIPADPVWAGDGQTGPR
jgi:hypothetical protein